MSNATVQWIGSQNDLTPTGVTEERANFLKIYGGEVLSCFEDATYLLDKHVVRTIPHGKSAQFPVIGHAPDAEYHTPGSEILGQQVYMAERVITIDRKLIHHIFMDELDEAMTHFDVRSRYAKLQGTKMAQTFDNHVARNIILAAQASASVTGGDGGLVLTDADYASATAATKLAALIDGIEAVTVNFMEKNIPKPWYLALSPANFMFLIRNVESSGWSPLHRDYGGSGSVASGDLETIFGVNIFPMNTLPVTDYSAAAFHAVNATNTVGIAFSEEAVGTLKLLSLSTEAEWDIRRQGWLMVAKYAYGHGILRPECAVHMRTAAPA